MSSRSKRWSVGVLPWENLLPATGQTEIPIDKSLPGPNGNNFENCSEKQKNEERTIRRDSSPEITIVEVTEKKPEGLQMSDKRWEKSRKSVKSLTYINYDQKHKSVKEAEMPRSVQETEMSSASKSSGGLGQLAMANLPQPTGITKISVNKSLPGPTGKKYEKHSKKLKNEERIIRDSGQKSRTVKGAERGSIVKPTDKKHKKHRKKQKKAERRGGDSGKEPGQVKSAKMKSKRLKKSSMKKEKKSTKKIKYRSQEHNSMQDAEIPRIDSGLEHRSRKDAEMSRIDSGQEHSSPKDAEMSRIESGQEPRSLKEAEMPRIDSGQEYKSVNEAEMPDKSVGPPCKRRQKCVEKWKKVQRKRKRDSGQEYTSVNGSEMPGKSIGPDCTCDRKCCDVVGKDHIKMIFDNYYNMASHDQQTAYLASRVSSQDVKRSRIKDKTSKVKRMMHYTVMRDNQEIKVCRTAFVNIHGVSVKRIRNAVDKAVSSGEIIPDQRGRHEPGTKISSMKIALVKEHIHGLCMVLRHCSTAESPKHKYLPRGLNRTKMYNKYKEWIITKGEGQENIVKFWKYCEIFNQQNIQFEPKE